MGVYRYFAWAVMLALVTLGARAATHDFGLLGPLYRGQQASFQLEYDWIPETSRWSVRLHWAKSLGNGGGTPGSQDGNHRAYSSSLSTVLLNSYGGFTTAESGTSGPFILNAGAVVAVQVEFPSYNEMVRREFTLPLQPDQQQIVTVTPAIGSIEYTATGGGASGQNTLQGTASGAQGGNAYHISALSGPITAAIIPSTGAWVLTATGLGPFTARVWAAAGNGYEQSNYATITGEVVDNLRHKVTVNFDNRGRDLATTFKVYQDGVLVYTESIPPNKLQMRTIEVPSDSPVAVYSVTSGIGETGGVFFVDQGAVRENMEGEFTPVQVPGNESPPPAGTVKPTDSPDTQQPQPANDKQVYQNVSAENAQSNLTNAMFAEGVDKMLAELRRQREAEADEAGMVAKGKSLVERWLLDFHVERFVSDLEGRGRETIEAVAAAGMTDFEAAVPVLGTASAIPAATGNPSVSWSLGVIDSGLPNGRWELKPFETFPWLRSMLLVIREVFLWGMCYIFYRNVQDTVMMLQTRLNQVPQIDTVSDGQSSAHGWAIPGIPSLVALAKRLFVGVSIITAINLTFVALIGVMNSRITEVFGGRWNLSNVGNVMQALAGKNEYFDHVATLVSLTFPINAAIQLMIAWLVFCFAAMLIYQAAASLVKATKI